jgi:hypothetical protein
VRASLSPRNTIDQFTLRAAQRQWASRQRGRGTDVGDGEGLHEGCGVGEEEDHHRHGGPPLQRRRVPHPRAHLQPPAARCDDASRSASHCPLAMLDTSHWYCLDGAAWSIRNGYILLIAVREIPLAFSSMHLPHPETPAQIPGACRACRGGVSGRTRRRSTLERPW